MYLAMLRRLLACLALITGFALFAAPVHAMPERASASASASIDNRHAKVTLSRVPGDRLPIGAVRRTTLQPLSGVGGQDVANAGFIVRVDRARE
ncbi:MAG: hypothetical protein WA954_01515 [Parerythrobacter sp.]